MDITGTPASEVLTGTETSDRIDGLGGDDTLRGLGGDDTLNGDAWLDEAAGDDLLEGGAGNDRLHGYDGDDTLDGGADDDSVFGDAGDDEVNGGDGDDYLDGREGDDTLDGGAGDDSLYAGQGRDLLHGGDGDDWLSGDGANDTLDGGAGFDIASYQSNDTAVVVDLPNDRVSFPGQNWSPETIISIEAAETGSGDDHLIGDDGANAFRAGAGNDLIEGHGGNDVLEGETGNDSLDGGAGNDSLSGGEGDDTLFGGTGTDTLNGGWGGFDIAVYDVNTTPLVADLEAGTISFTGQSWSPETLMLIDGIIGGSASDYLSGNGEANLLVGGQGSDTLIGGAGNDTLEGGGNTDQIEGGEGNDTAVYSENTTAIRADLRSGVVSFPGQSWSAENLVSIESLVTGSGDDTVIGTEGANSIETGAGRDRITARGGNDTLDGGAGADTMSGGSGNDTYVIDNSGDRINEGGGTDTVLASVDYALGSALEHLTLTGDGGISGTGNGRANVLRGNEGDNTLSGLDGDDTVIGGFGDDDIRGGNGDDVLSGGFDGRLIVAEYLDDVDWLPPDDGADRIDGGSGTDTLIYPQFIGYTGGDNTTPYLDRNIDVDLAAGTARAEGVSGTDTLISIENVETGNGDDTITGDAKANEIRVNYGLNVVDGGGGDDVIHGGRGLHLPIDVSEAEEPPYGLEDTLEVLSGGAGNDVIYSGGSIIYYDQNNFAMLFRATDVLEGGGGDDRLVAGDGTYQREGSLRGASVEMTGGAGADRFEFTTEIWEHSDMREGFITGTYGQLGTVTDFDRSEGDRIVIHTGGQSLSFGGEDASLEVNEITYRHVTDGGTTDTVVEVLLTEYELEPYDDPVLTITLAGYAGDLTEEDFLLI